ncbi:MAG: LLM class flavin-dependent oxidoreductase [Dehalococcoidia bacterium]
MAEQGIIGLHVVGRTAVETLDGIVRAEQRGIPAAWLTTGGVSPDGLTVIAAAAVQTRRILLGTSITPTYPRHPLVTVQQTLAIAQLATGRFRLGVGPSHKPAMEGTFGIPFTRPLTHLRAYLDVLHRALHEGAVDRDEEPFRVHARLAAPVEVPVYASALQEKSFELCGEVADGAITWMCPPAYVRDVALPAFRRGAEKAGRPLPRLIVHVPVSVDEDAAAVREAARAQLGFYMRVPSYARMTAAAGYPEAEASGMSDAHVDALVAHGDELQVAERLREWLRLGANEIIAAPVAAGPDRAAIVERTIALIAAMNTSRRGR